jgi:hypothetical protein
VESSGQGSEEQEAGRGGGDGARLRVVEAGHGGVQRSQCQAHLPDAASSLCPPRVCWIRAIHIEHGSLPQRDLSFSRTDRVVRREKDKR